MNRSLLVVALIGLGGCRLNPDCFRSDECNPGFVCIEQICVGATADAQVDGGTVDADHADGGSADAAPADADPADEGPTDTDVPDIGPTDAADIDAGPPDSGSHVDRDCRGVIGNPLPNGRSALPVSERDILLLHFDDPDDLGFNASGYRAAATNCANCTADMCKAYDGSLSGGTLTYTFNNLAPLTVVESLHHLEAWVFWDGNPGCFIRTRTEKAGPLAWSLCIAADGAVSPEQTVTSTRVDSVLTQNTWHHIDVFYDDTEAYVWIDGVQDGGQYTITSSRLLNVASIEIMSDVVEIDELRLAGTLGPEYPTSRSRPRVCSAYKGLNDALFVAGETLEKPRQLQGTGDYPRLAPDLQSVVYIQCNTSCGLIQEDLVTGATSTIATGLRQGLPAAIDAQGNFHYVLENAPSVMVRQTTMTSYTVDLSHPITAFDVGWNDGPNGPGPLALVATADPAGTPRIQVVDFMGTTAAISTTVPWDGAADEEVMRLSMLGVDPLRAVFSTDFEGHWAATVRRDGGGDYLIFGNRNRCSPNCATVDPAPTINPAQTPSRYVTGFDSMGRLIIDSPGAPAVLSQPTSNSQLDLQWSFAN